MGRGKYYGWWRQAGEAMEAAFYQENWAARIAYALGLQGQLHLDRRDFYLPLAKGFTCKLAFISDLHAGPLTDYRLIEQAFAAIAAFEPDVILFGGDYVSLHARHMQHLAGPLGLLDPATPKFAVMGNHDLWLDDEHIANCLQDAGVQVLVNQNRRLPAPFEAISICGTDEPGVGMPDAEQTFAGAGDVRLLLMHSPLGLRHVARHDFAIAFCGHTHGGQIATPGGMPLVLPPGSGERRYAQGLFPLPGQRLLLTSRGIGMSDLPIRLFAPSEVHLCHLHSVHDGIEL
ncbi:metallophosphoesterase [Undibacterium sp. Di27W]|uniref:metallophosphoesterase n=1 Tax=Undibacterium sp. Di27W TaxID=3413036 RepID=UPI003BF1CF41